MSAEIHIGVRLRARCQHCSGYLGGSPATPALVAMTSISPVILTGSFDSDSRSVNLPDSPVFDFLRPPTRA